MNYIKAAKKATELNETNDCSVKAVSIACDVPYFVAHKALKLQGRRNRKGSLIPQIRRAFESLGFKTVQVKHKAATVSTLANDSTVQQGFYVAVVSRHILAVVNGKIEDWSEGSRRRIESVYRVEPTATRKERKEKRDAILRA